MTMDSPTIRPTRTLAFVLTALALATAAAAQSVPPDADWRTFRTTHFRVTYEAGLEPVARRAALVAERTYTVLSRDLTEPPAGVIDLVVADHADYSNGFSQPFPSNRIVLFARPAATGEFYARDWIELVTTHELVHTFHFEQSGAVGERVRAVFGRLPTWWPVFPVIATPRWSTEGLATHYESRLTGAGRIQSGLHDMFIRTAALDSALPVLPSVSAPHPTWPAVNRAYIYGGHFMRWLADRYGPEAHRAIIEATAGSIWPTFLRFDHVGDRAVGTPFNQLYEEWRVQAADSARAVARQVRAAGETETRPVAGRGPYAVAPRVSPDGRRLSFAASDWRSDPATRVLELPSGEPRTLARRNQFGIVLDPASWLPDGSGVVVAQLEFQGPYRLYSDFWRVDLDGREHRLTRGLRLTQPDVGPDGRIAAIAAEEGALRLVVYDPDAGVRALAEAVPGQSFDGPRWSPDGRWIAVGRHTDGRTDLVVVDAATGGTVRVTDDTPLDMAPAWSPDGRWLLWWSDRTGIPNILAVGFRDGRPAGPVRQVTNVVTGVIDPEVGPDGETLYLAAYHPDGWRIEAMPFDTAGWREAPPPQDRYTAALLPPPAPLTGGERNGAPGTAGSARPADGSPSSYSPWPTLRPYFWLPTYREVGGATGVDLRFLGARARGRDVVGRHSWDLELAADLHSGRLRGLGLWTYRGLGTPELFVVGQRHWLGVGVTGDAGEPVFQREDELAAGALFRHRRWRRDAAVQLTGEVEHLHLEGRDLSRTALEAAGDTLPGSLTLAGVAVGPSLSTARRYPISISPENGVSLSATAGRWWDVGGGAHAYDQVAGSLTGYLGLPAWGYANHVLAVRGRGFLRRGALVPPRSIGGVAEGDLLVARDAGSTYPVRGYTLGDRWGTRGWTANAEWRFPIHLRDVPAGLLGFSLVSVSGSLFFDAGNAWCPAAHQDRLGSGCARTDPLASAGAELALDLGVFHSMPARLAAGVAQPLAGGSPVLYVGTAF